MDETDTSLKTSNNDIPKVPIKTYRWEDVRRSRKRGAYPWTHLTKPPFDEEIDPEEYTLDAFRMSRSTSTLGKSDIQEISEVEDNVTMVNETNISENKENVPKATTSKGIMKTQLKPIHDNDNGKRAKSEEPKRKRKLSMESSYSRSSSSKLSLMGKLKDAKNKLLKRSKSDASDLLEKKQKLEAEKFKEHIKSSRLTTVKDESPVYIHIPLKPPEGETDEFSKFEFESPSHSQAGSLLNIPHVFERQRKPSLLEVLTQIKLVHEQHEKVKQPNFEPTKRIRLRPLDDESENTDKNDNDKLTIEEIQDDEQKSNKSTEDSKPESERTHTPKITEPEDSSADDNISQYLDKDDKFEISEKSTNVSSENVSQLTPTHVEIEKQDPESVRKIESTLSKWKMYLPPPSPLDPPINYPLPARAKSEEPKRKRRPSLESSYSRKSLSKLAIMKKLKQARSKIKLPKLPSFAKFDKKASKKPKPEKKQVTVAQSTQLKPSAPQEAVYIHIPLKPPPGQTDQFSHLINTKDEEYEQPEPTPMQTEEEAESEPTSPENDVQIIILTPPSDDEILDSGVAETPTETDQKCFSDVKIEDLKTLAKTAVDSIYPEPTVTEPEEPKEIHETENTLNIQEVSAQNEENKDSTPSTPEPQPKNDIQLIILSPPSDDEILDETAADTPPEPDRNYIEEYKTLARSAVDIVCSNPNLDEIGEDSNLNTSIPKEDEEKVTEVIQKPLQVFFDEEDGLKLSEAAIAMINEEMEKELKEQEEKQVVKPESPFLIKKKVSFKRRSKTADGERIYEDVEINPKIPLETFQSMSVDEEKSYLDKQIIKTTSLEEDYNRWSKLNDHEYEPVNPPPEEMVERSSPTNNIEEKQVSLHKLTVDVDNDHQGTTPEKYTAPKIQEDTRDRSFNIPQEKRSAVQEQSSVSQSISSNVTPKIEDSGKSFNETLRLQAAKIKTKLQNIKKPNITLPKRPKFPSTKLKKPNFKKPNFTMPKMPNLPTFNLTRKDNSKDSWRKRQFSTESNAGDSKKKIFDFRTYPRMFDKSKRKEDDDQTPPATEFATVPRTSRKSGPVGSLWAAKIKDVMRKDEETKQTAIQTTEKTLDKIRIPLHSEDSMDAPTHTSFDEDIGIEDDFDQENENNNIEPPVNEQYLKRWKHGEFHEGPVKREEYIDEMYNEDDKVPDINNEMDDAQIPPEESFDIEVSPTKEEQHSSGSLSEHHRGVLEEIDSDEFFLREKGISQDNIEVGKYLSSEIREAFRNPINALSQLQSEDREYDLEISDQSEPIQNSFRRKPLKKPKRKKTPHVSNEQISFDRDSVTTEPEEYPKSFKDFERFTPPARPKRKSKRTKKKKQVIEDVVPYQETIPIEEQMQTFIPQDYTFEIERSEIMPDNILGDDSIFFDNRLLQQIYENEHMKGIEQPEIRVLDPYYKYHNFEDMLPNEAPIVPPRRHRSSRSLSVSEHDSHFEEVNLGLEEAVQEVEVYPNEHEYIIPTPEPPVRPKRTRSRTRSRSRMSQQEEDQISRDAESPIFDNQAEVVEEPCVQDIRDTSGYAVIDKSRNREPPLPPPRMSSTPSAPRRAKKNKSHFATVPRPSRSDPPVRPLRNYSTLGDPKKSRSHRSITPTFDDDEKENIDITKYMENDDDPARRLQSGEVIQKMKDRPLPAPPRPPRRPRSSNREALRDISHERNLPDDFKFEDKIQTEEIDTELQDQNALFDNILSDIEQQIEFSDHEETITHGALLIEPIDDARFLSHSQFMDANYKISEHTSDERIIPITQNEEIENEESDQTHIFEDSEKTLVQEQESPEEEHSIKEKEPMPEEEETEIKKEEPLLKEEITEIRKEEHLIKKEEEYDDDETSEIPEEFTKLKSPEPVAPTQTQATDQNLEFKHVDSIIPPQRPERGRKSIDHSIEPLHQEIREVEILKAQKLQVVDLDVDKLRVNELQASKIIVSELEGVSLQVSEINSKSGNLIVSGIELPPQIIQEMLDKLHLTAQEQLSNFPNQPCQSSEATTQTSKLESESTVPQIDNIENDKIGQKKNSD